MHLLKKTRFVFILLVYLFLSSNLIKASKIREKKDFNSLVNICYKDINYCDSVLFRINSYQKKALKNKKFSCQTRLLGLEANLIMAMNFNLKIKDSKNIIDAASKYC